MWCLAMAFFSTSSCLCSVGGQHTSHLSVSWPRKCGLLVDERHDNKAAREDKLLEKWSSRLFRQREQSMLWMWWREETKWAALRRHSLKQSAWKPLTEDKHWSERFDWLGGSAGRTRIHLHRLKDNLASCSSLSLAVETKKVNGPSLLPVSFYCCSSSDLLWMRAEAFFACTPSSPFGSHHLIFLTTAHPSLILASRQQPWHEAERERERAAVFVRSTTTQKA